MSSRSPTWGCIGSLQRWFSTPGCPSRGRGPRPWWRVRGLVVASVVSLESHLTTTCCTSLQVRLGAASSTSASTPAARGAAAEVPGLRLYTTTPYFLLAQPTPSSSLNLPPSPSSSLLLCPSNSLLLPPPTSSAPPSPSSPTCVAYSASSPHIRSRNLLVCVGARAGVRGGEEGERGERVREVRR